MPGDVFLQIDGIKGESTDSKHKEWIEVLSYNWGVSQMASAIQSSSGGGTTQRADFQDLSIVKLMDSSSPKLFAACAQGDHIAKVILELCRAAGKEHLPYMNYELENVVITSVSVGGGGGGEPTESVTFNYGKIKQVYTTQKRKGGGGGGKIPAGWSLEENKPI
jgi:type VI secretion system secreted protein Hcp